MHPSIQTLDHPKPIEYSKLFERNDTRLLQFQLDPLLFLSFTYFRDPSSVHRTRLIKKETRRSWFISVRLHAIRSASIRNYSKETILDSFNSTTFPSIYLGDSSSVHRMRLIKKETRRSWFTSVRLHAIRLASIRNYSKETILDFSNSTTFPSIYLLQRSFERP